MIPKNFSFFNPTRVEFGAGIIENIGRELKQCKANKALVVTDPGVIKTGIVHQVEESLLQQGIDYAIYADIVPNPRDTDMEAGAVYAEKEGIDTLVAVGGGSAMDTAKAIGTLLTHGGRILDWCGVFKLKREITPLVAIPTTAGTGSEVTAFAVVTDTKRHIKQSIWDPKAAAKVALLDPTLLLGLPPSIMASTGIDALTHAIEAYTCKESTPYTDAFALQAIELIAANLREAVKAPSLSNCSAMLLASNFAGIAIGFADVAAVHCMAEALGGRYDIPHGVANAMLLSTVSKFNTPANTKKYARISQAMGLETNRLTTIEAALLSSREMERLCEDINIPKMRDFKAIEESDFPALAKAAQENTSTPSNPIMMDEGLYLELFKKAYRS